MKKILLLLAIIFSLLNTQAASSEMKSTSKFETKKVKSVTLNSKKKVLKIASKKKTFSCATGVGTISGSCWAIDYFYTYCDDSLEPGAAAMVATMIAQSQVRNYIWLLNILETELPC